MIKQDATADPSELGTPNDPSEPGAPISTTRRRARRLVVWAIFATLIFFAVRTLVRVQWDEVGHALGTLEVWQVGILILLIAVRLMLTSAPLAFFVKGLGVPRAIGNDLVGNLVATVTPAPADIVARMALFRSWGIDIPRGMAGLVLNSILYYVVRLIAPLVGAILMLSVVNDDAGLGWPALASGLAGLAIVGALWWGAKSSASAEKLGRLLGRAMIRIRKSWPGPELMGTRALEFHANIADRWQSRWYLALGSLTGMVVVETAILVCALRFVGVGPDLVSTALIAGSFLSVYLLMATPFLGLGILDVAVIAVIADVAGIIDSSDLVAGLIVWRVCVQLAPLIAGAVPLMAWRRSEK